VMLIFLPPTMRSAGSKTSGTPGGLSKGFA